MGKKYIKDATWYASLTEEQRERKREQSRAYKQRNREKLIEKQREYYKNNTTLCNARAKEWKENNREKVANWDKNNRETINKAKRARYKKLSPEQIEQRRAKQRQRYANNPSYAIEMRLRASLNLYMRKNGTTKSASIKTLLGCDFDSFKSYLEKQFLENMSWENRDLWEIDHIRPCASFDLTNPKDQAACFHYTNFQPLWRPDNRRKGKTWGGSK